MLRSHPAIRRPGTASAAGPARARRRVVAAVSMGAAALLAQPASAQTNTGYSDSAAPSVYSDRLHVVSPDGRAHLVQHTLASDGVAAALRPSRTPLQVRFTGPDRERAAARYARVPGRASLTTGSVTLRYRDRYTEELREDDDGILTLSTASMPAALELDVARADDVESAITWVFPPGVDVLSWAASAPPEALRTATAPGSADGAWSFDDNVLGWTQRGSAAAALEIRYRLAPSAVELGATPAPVPVAASPPSDADGDGVPDARDVCIGVAATRDAVAEGGAAAAASLGCAASGPIALPAVGFDTGQSRLDVPARRLLDRLGAALRSGADPAWDGGIWEIGAHTDGVGPRSRNQALSLRRAESVRHYLMLGGVAPERLVANGYGEGDPVADDATAAGRAANRRVELRWVGDPAGEISGSSPGPMPTRPRSSARPAGSPP